MPATGKAFLANPTASAGGRVIASPFQFTTDGNDRLFVRVANSQTGVIVNLNARVIDNAGAITVASWTITPATDRSISEQTFPLGVGALMNVTAFVTGATPKIGQTYVQVFLKRGDGAAAQIYAQLLGGYCTSNQHVSWPGSPIQSSLEGGGVIRTFGGTLPAAGANLSETVPTGARWELLFVSAAFTSSATVTGREIRLRLRSGADLIGVIPGPSPVPASTSVQITWGQALETISPMPLVRVDTTPLPRNAILLAGQIFDTSTVNIQPGDSYSAPIYTVREWLEVQ